MITKKKLLEMVVLDYPSITPRTNMEAFKSVVSLTIRSELDLQPDILENSEFKSFVHTYCYRVSTLSKTKGGLKQLLKYPNAHLEFFSTEITVALVLNQHVPPPPRFLDKSTQTLKKDVAVGPRFVYIKKVEYVFLKAKLFQVAKFFVIILLIKGNNPGPK